MAGFFGAGSASIAGRAGSRSVHAIIAAIAERGMEVNPAPVLHASATRLARCCGCVSCACSARRVASKRRPPSWCTLGAPPSMTVSTVRYVRGRRFAHARTVLGQTLTRDGRALKVDGSGHGCPHTLADAVAPWLLRPST